MRITVDPGTPALKPILAHAVRFCVARYMGISTDRLTELYTHKVHLEIVALDKHPLPDKNGQENFVAGVTYFDGRDSWTAKNWYLGLFDEAGEVSPAKLLLILCHEAIHMGQYLTGRLKVKQGWHGHLLSENEPRDLVFNKWRDEIVDAKYDDHPWEQEAYGLQDEYLLALADDPTFLQLCENFVAAQTTGE